MCVSVTGIKARTFTKMCWGHLLHMCGNEQNLFMLCVCVCARVCVCVHVRVWMCLHGLLTCGFMQVCLRLENVRGRGGGGGGERERERESPRVTSYSACVTLPPRLDCKSSVLQFTRTDAILTHWHACHQQIKLAKLRRNLPWFQRMWLENKA